MKPDDIVLSVPHAGTTIPGDIRSRIPHNDALLNRESDLYTDRIYIIDGMRAVIAQHSQIIADVNRAPDEIYTEGANRSQGVVKLSLSEGQSTFAVDPSLEEMNEWIVRLHRPFHEKLAQATFLENKRFLIDCHSMWSRGARLHANPGAQRADIVLGNREYSSCSAEVTHFFRSYFESLGYSVKINKPFYGRYIVGTYCSRVRMRGIQIEINRGLYMNEQNLKPDEEAIAKLNRQIKQAIELFCEWDEEHGSDRHIIDLSGH